MKTLTQLSILLLCCFTAQCQMSTPMKEHQFPLQKTNEEWQKELSSEEYRVLRLKGTELAFTGKFNNFKGEGTYTCAACNHPLFHSETKYNSGSGWPSYWAPISDSSVHLILDKSHGMVRTEVVCANCGGHLGHVFEDGPQPTGLRYCINSVSMGFKEEQ